MNEIVIAVAKKAIDDITRKIKECQNIIDDFVKPIPKHGTREWVKYFEDSAPGGRLSGASLAKAYEDKAHLENELVNLSNQLYYWERGK